MSVRAAALAGALLAACALWPAAASSHFPPGPAQPCGTDAVLHKDQWTVIKPPKELARVSSHAVGGTDGKLLLASDGQRVVRSADSGCTWSESWQVETAGLPENENAPSVAELAYPSGDASRAFILLDGIARAAGSRVMASSDGGRTWEASGSGLPSTGGFRQIVGHANNLYVVVAYNDSAGDNDPVGVTGALYASSDRGKTWEQRSGGVQIERVAVDPFDGNRLWAVRADHSVERSDDGGRTWTEVDLTGDPDQAVEPGAAQLSNWRDIAVARRADEPATVVIAASETRIAKVSRVMASQDGGRHFHDLPVAGLGPVTGVTFGNSPNQIIMAAGSESTAWHGPGLRAYDIPQGRWRDVDDQSLESLYAPRGYPLSAVTRGHEGFGAIQLRRHASEGGDLIAQWLPPDPPPNADLLDRVRCGATTRPPDTPGDPKPKAVTWDPGDLSLLLKPGQTTRLPLKAKLAPVPTPLDVDFLIDSSNSMDPAIDGVKCSVQRMARELSEKNVDATFGVGTYTDRYERRFLRMLDLAPFGPELGSALDRLLTQRGKEETMRSGLYQTATGAGLEYDDSDFDEQRLQHTAHISIPAGQQADYRAGALHTALIIGDEPYEETTPGEPSRDDVVAALKRKGILAIGVQVMPPVFTTTSATDPTKGQIERDPDRYPERQALLRQQLVYFAQQSGALAPKGGVDCDGNGTVDIQAGQPLVCPVDERGIRESLGDTLLTLLNSRTDVRDVKLVPVKTGGLDVSLEGGEAKNVDVKKASALAATAVLSCSAAQLGKTFDISFAAQVAGRTVGTLDGTVRCGRRPVAAVPPHRPRAAHSPAPGPAPTPAPAKAPAPTPSSPTAAAPAPPNPAAIVAPSPPPPTPAPVTPTPAVSPGAAPASAPAAGSAPTPASAVAAAPHRETKVQVARVQGDHAMTAWRPTRAEPRDSVPAPALITLGLGACAAFGFVALSAATRRRPRVVPERVRRR